MLKNSLALYSASASGAKYAVFVLFRPRFRALLDHRPGRQPLFRQAGVFSEVRHNGVLGSRLQGSTDGIMLVVEDLGPLLEELQYR